MPFIVGICVPHTHAQTFKTEWKTLHLICLHWCIKCYLLSHGWGKWTGTNDPERQGNLAGLMRKELRYNGGVELPLKKEDAIFLTDSRYLFQGICNLTCVNKGYGDASFTPVCALPGQ